MIYGRSRLKMPVLEPVQLKDIVAKKRETEAIFFANSRSYSELLTVNFREIWPILRLLQPLSL